MAEKSIIDPVDRIEGHLRIEMTVEDGKCTDAWVSGGLFRGLELILQGREPTDATHIAQRICGVCPVSHCHTSAYAAEAAYGIQHPEGARVVRNLVEGAQFMHSHILWFYHLSALDYVNPLNAVNANPAKAADLCESLGLSPIDYDGLLERLKKFAENGQYSWLSGGWFLDGQAPEAYKLPPEIDLIATGHYIEALDMQATADEIAAIIGGKMPHILTSIPGGTAFVPNVDKIDDILFRCKQLNDWVNNVMIPDAIAIASVYLDDVVGIGNNKHGNFMAYGVFDKEDRDMHNRYLPAGIVRMANDTIALEEFDGSNLSETTAHAYYADDGTPLHPTEGVTTPPVDFPGYDINNDYTWSKAPRYDGQPMEVGPLARVLVAYASGVDEIKTLVDTVITSLGLEVSDATILALNSALGRLAARPIEASYVSSCMIDWCSELVEILSKDSDENPWFTKRAQDSGTGEGFWEAPRGALYHTETIENNKITHYQCIVPSTWNISPRDENGVAGTIEQGLIGVPITNLEAPINALRIVHGYDPCVACAIHLVEPKTGKTFEAYTSPWGGR